MQVNPYLSFNGDCEAAFKFYEQCLGARIGGIFRYAGSPLEGQVPADWSDKVMHGNLTFGEQVIQGADVTPQAYEEPKGFSFSIQLHEHVGRRANLSRAGGRRQGDDAAPEDVLGRAVRHGRRSLRHPVADQLRGPDVAPSATLGRLICIYCFFHVHDLPLVARLLRRAPGGDHASAGFRDRRRAALAGGDPDARRRVQLHERPLFPRQDRVRACLRPGGRDVRHHADARPAVPRCAS